MKRTNRLTEGNILHTLIRFAVPVFFTLFLQALYGGVDLLVVGQFAATADVSGVATGSMLMSTVTMVITGLSMGITILVGERIGRGEPDEAGRAIGGGICLFAAFGVLLTVVLLAGAEPLARLLHAPEEAFAETVEDIGVPFFLCANSSAAAACSSWPTTCWGRCSGASVTPGRRCSQ